MYRLSLVAILLAGCSSSTTPSDGGGIDSGTDACVGAACAADAAGGDSGGDAGDVCKQTGQACTLGTDLCCGTFNTCQASVCCGTKPSAECAKASDCCIDGTMPGEVDCQSKACCLTKGFLIALPFKTGDCCSGSVDQFGQCE